MRPLGTLSLLYSVHPSVRLSLEIIAAILANNNVVGMDDNAHHHSCDSQVSQPAADDIGMHSTSAVVH